MKISVKNIDIIYKSSGLIEKKSIEIAKTMYVLLFDLHPEMKTIFEGAPSNQHKLLAETISAYAVNINNLDILKPALEKICKKHEEHGVQPHHYEIIEDVMLKSFKIVLGKDATDELIKAWSEVIKFVSYILIEMEKELYSKSFKNSSSGTGLE